MAWQAETFEDMPKFATPISIPIDAQYSGAINNINDLQSALANKSIDVIQWTGGFIDTRVELNTGHLNSGQRRFITGTGDLPPIRVFGGPSDAGWTVYNMTFGSDEPSDYKGQRIDLINSKNFILSDCERYWAGDGSFIHFANLRGESTDNLIIQRNNFQGTQTSAREFMAVIAPSWTADFHGNDYWDNGQWDAETNGFYFFDNRCHNIGDSVQLQCELNVAETRNRHYTVVDHKDVECAGNLLTSDAGLAENGFDFKASAQNYADRAKIHHNVIAGFRPAEGGGTDALGEGIVVHFQHQHVEIADNIIDYCNIGMNIKPPSGTVDILRNRFSRIPSLAIVGEQYNYDPSTASLTIDECLFDDVAQFIDNKTGTRTDTNWTVNNSVFRNVRYHGNPTTASLQGTGNFFDSTSGDELSTYLSGQVVTMNNIGSLDIPTGAVLDVFDGYPSDHPWYGTTDGSQIPSDHLQVNLQQESTTFDLGYGIKRVGDEPEGGPSIYRTDWHGHYWFITASGNQSEQFSGEQTLRNNLCGAYPWNPSNKTGLRGIAPKLRWDWINTGDGVHGGAGVTQLDNHYDYCDANGLICWPDLTDINFGGNTSWTPTKSFAPTYIENSGGAMVGGNPSNISASAKLHVGWVMDKFVETLLWMHNRYKDRPSYVGFTVPETTRAEHTGGSLSSSGNYQNIGYEMFTQFKRMITNFRAGAPGALLKIQFNYLDSYLDDLVEHADAAGGVIIGTPDTLRNKSVAIYPLIRQKENIMGVHLHWETREIESSPNTAWDFCFNDSDKLNPQAITHFSWHPDNNNWQSDTLSKLQAENWYVNPAIPSDLAGSLEPGEGTPPEHSTWSYSGSDLTLYPKVTATAGVTEDFTVEGTDDIDRNHTLIYVNGSSQTEHTFPEGISIVRPTSDFSAVAGEATNIVGEYQNAYSIPVIVEWEYDGPEGQDSVQ